MVLKDKSQDLSHADKYGNDRHGTRQGINNRHGADYHPSIKGGAKKNGGGGSFTWDGSDNLKNFDAGTEEGEYVEVSAAEGLDKGIINKTNSSSLDVVGGAPASDTASTPSSSPPSRPGQDPQNWPGLSKHNDLAVEKEVVSKDEAKRNWTLAVYTDKDLELE